MKRKFPKTLYKMFLNGFLNTKFLRNFKIKKIFFKKSVYFNFFYKTKKLIFQAFSLKGN